MLRIGEPRKVASDPAGMTDISWSPDSRRLCFVRGDERICLLDLSTGGESAIARGAAPAFAPDGASLFFSRSMALFKCSVVSGAESPVSISDRRYGGLPVHSPLPSPDGTKLLFQCMELEDRELGRKHTFFCLDDQRTKSVIRLPAEATAASAVWSNDSARIACSNYESGARIFMVRSSGEQEARFHGLSPAFSPDSSRIAFKNIDALRLRVLKEGDWVPSGDPIRMPDVAAVSSYNRPVWLDENTLLVEESNRIFHIALAAQRVTAVGGIEGLVKRGCPTLSWAPDGARFAAEVAEDSGTALLVYEIAS